MCDANVVKICASLWLVLLAACLLNTIADAAQSGRLILLSTQLRPIEEAQKMRNLILKDVQREVDYITEHPDQFPVRIKEELQGATQTIDVVGALHGELQPLVPLNALVPVDDLVATVAGRGMPGALLTLGKLGTKHQLYIPWMQAGYIMVANKAALPYLPVGAEINTLSYDQLAAWAGTIEQRTGKRMLGFPAGPRGLMHRFFEGFLYPSYTGGVVAPFRSEAAEGMWAQFASLWKTVNPNSTSYNFMQQPLLSGEVWIGFDHTARIRNALRQRPDEFVAFPAPAGPKGRGHMPVLVGLGVLKNPSDMSGALAVIDYLTQPTTQIAAARSVGFFPVVKVAWPSDIEPGVQIAAAAMENMQSAKDALPTLIPTGLGDRTSEFEKVFMDTFQRIVLRGQKPRAVLDREAETLKRLMAETGAPCWAPDPPSTGPCQVH